MSIRKLVCTVGFILLPGWAAAGLPTADQVKTAYRPSDAELLDRHGQLLQSLRIDMTVRRLPWVALSDISSAVPAAIIQAEDQRFYQHHGIDVEALGKATWDNLFRQRPRGASTITMQLVSLLNQELQPKKGRRSLEQKWDQISAARELEKTWSKPQILEAYLNLVSFRGELQGIGAASQNLFGKAPSGLTDIESVILASLIPAPNATPKMVAMRACNLAKERKLAAPYGSIKISTENALAAFSKQTRPPIAMQVAQKLLKTAGEKVVSTIDGAVQNFAIGSLHQQLSSLRDRNVNDGAIIVIDNQSGDILAYAGNAGNKSVDGVVALRQAGSTLKPFLYELAIEKRQITAASILDDSPIDISTPAGLYIPQNYDKDFKGYVSVRTSLASSLNVPAVRTLVMTGMEAFYDRLKQLGLSSLTESADYYGYSLALGSAEVSLLELTNAYRTLANGGTSNATGLIQHDSSTKRRVMDQRASYIVNDILSDRAARSITFGLSNELATSYWTAVKTGTSKDMRDNWCVGFSEKYTVGVWVGNFDGEPMWDVSGVTGAAPIWHDVMDFLHKNTPSHAAPPPKGIVAQQIEYSPPLEPSRKEWFVSGTESSKIEMLAHAKRMSKILYPGNGSIIAIDPDIPDANQRLFFQSQAGNDLMWQLDGTVLGAANADLPWRPTKGAHHLVLITKDGRPIDAISFHVRGDAK